VNYILLHTFSLFFSFFFWGGGGGGGGLGVIEVLSNLGAKTYTNPTHLFTTWIHTQGHRYYCSLVFSTYLEFSPPKIISILEAFEALKVNNSSG
jgi:hypothetical protein